MTQNTATEKKSLHRRNSFNKDNLQCIISPCKIFNSDFYDLNYQIYNFWRSSWTKTFSEIDQSFSQTSEEYCRHHKVVSLRYQGEIIACALLDLFDLHSPIHKDHKYFLAYPENVFTDFLKLSEKGPVMTVGYLTVDPRFKLQPFIAQLLSGLVLKYYYSTDVQLLITYTRNTKRVNQLAFRFGGIPLAENLIAFGEPTDFVYFSQLQYQNLKLHPYYDDFYFFWNERLEIKNDNSLDKLNKRRPNNEKNNSTISLSSNA